MKKIFVRFYLLVFILLFVKFVHSQDVMVFNKQNSMPLAGVYVFCDKTNDTLQTNNDGEVNINIFPDNAIIYFALPPLFKTAKYTKQELENEGFTVYLDFTPMFSALTPSRITAKEYSEDLPFYVDIINMDDDTGLETDENASAGNRVSVSNYEKSSTVFRALEPKKMLLVLDGIPLNDEIHRNGKVEVLLNFDKTMTQRIQQIYGPSFTIYSPEAIGGVIQYFTRMPKTSVYNSSKFQVTSKYASAMNAFINNANLTVSRTKWASFTSLSYGKFGQITMGKNRKNLPEADSLYGLDLYYVERRNDTDYMELNPDPYKQKGTEYNQLYFLQKFRLKLRDHLNIFINLHYINTSHTGIYSGMTEFNGQHYRFAECYYGPQNKIIGNFNILYDRKHRYFDFLSFNSAFIHYNETRVTRKFNNPVKLEQNENISIYKFNLDFVKLFNTNRLIYGLNYAYNDLRSTALFTNILADTSWFGLTRYPTSGSYSHTAGIYLGYRILSLATMVADISGRYNYKYTFADFSGQSSVLPINLGKYFTSVNVFAFGMSISYLPFSWLQFKTNASYSMHPPTIDDFGKIMFKDFVVSVPHTGLKPEKAYSAEFGISFFAEDKFKIYANAFVTYTNDAIILKDSTLNGQDSIFLGKDAYNVATHVNIPKSVIYGISGGFYFNHYFDYYQKTGIKLNGSLNYAIGENLSEDLPLPQISPSFGSVRLELLYYNLSIKLSTVFNGAKPYNQLSPVGEDYIEKASSEGFLAWQIYNVKASYKIGKFKFLAGVENIFDLFYRQYASGLSANGRNITFACQVTF